jgi:hypothetical protein
VAGPPLFVGLRCLAGRVVGLVTHGLLALLGSLRLCFLALGFLAIVVLLALAPLVVLFALAALVHAVLRYDYEVEEAALIEVAVNALLLGCGQGGTRTLGGEGSG